MGEGGIGHVELIVAKREAAVARLSPAARHQAFPKLYARPIPRDATVLADPTLPLKAEIARLKEQVAELTAENATLHRAVENLNRPPWQRSNVKVEDVQLAYLNAMTAAGYRLDDQPYGIQHMRSQRRARPYSDPRLVCMWVSRLICVEHSYPRIAAAFGNRDHTTAMHACKRAPKIIAANPLLHDVARTVLTAFGVPMQGEAA